MYQHWILFATVLPLLFNCLTASNVQCTINANESVTVYNLKNNCNNKELLSIFLNLKTGTFPPNSKFKGHILACPGGPCDLLEGMIESVWSGKNIIHTGGATPNEHGTVTNNMLGIFKMFKAAIYRTNAPIDGREAFAIDYKSDLFLFLLMDYVRKIQKNLYLGIVTLRPFIKHPILFFLLEIVN